MTRAEVAAYNSRKGELTAKQRLFVEAYVKSMDRKAAALAAGCPPKSATTQAAQWLDSGLYPLVVREVNRQLALIEEQVILDAQEIRRRIHTVVNTSLLDHFEPEGEGWWSATLEAFRALPLHVKRMVEDVEVKNVRIEAEDGSVIEVKRVRCRMISKTKALELAAKYGLTEHSEVDVRMVNVNWSDLYGKSPSPDLVEARIAGVKELTNGEVKTKAETENDGEETNNQKQENQNNSAR